MARETATALICNACTAECTTLERVRNGFRVAAFRRHTPTADVQADPADGAVPSPVAPDLPPDLCGHANDRLHVGMPTADLLIRIVNLPNGAKDELREMAQLQLEKISPFPIEDTTFSCEVLAVGQDLSRVLMVAARLGAAEAIRDRLAAVGLKAQRMDAGAMGWWTLLRDAGATSGSERHLHAVVRACGTELLVADHGELMAVRYFPPPDETIAAADWSRETAVEIRHALMAVELEHGAAETVTATVWQDADTAELLPEHIADICAAATTRQALADLPPLSEGLARRAMQGGGPLLDLSPDIWQVSEREQGQRRRIRRVGLTLTVGWAVLMVAVFGGVYAEEQRLEKQLVLQAQWTAPANEVRELRQRIRTMREHLDQSRSFLECFREIVQAMPPGVVLTRVVFTKNDTLDFSGQADHHDLAYQLQRNIVEIPLFTGSELKGPNLDPRTRKQNFSVIVKLAEKTP